MKPTFITGVARIGNLMRQATIRIHEERLMGGTAIRRTYVAVTVGGSEFNPWNAQWRTLRASRNAAAAALYSDGRLSRSGPGLFAFSAASITKRDGTLMGKEESFDAFVQHMLLVSGDGAWKGETAEDRVAIAAEVLAQKVWAE
jgi:hypothetical protein